MNDKPPTFTSLITFDHLRALENDASRGFWQDVDVRENPYDCWEWKRGASRYGRVNVPAYISDLGRPVMLHAHRVALALHLGHLLPPDLVVDHRCDNWLCCNPYHLELVTQRFNSSRSRRTIEEIRKPRWGVETLVEHPESCARVHRATETNTHVWVPRKRRKASDLRKLA